MRYFHLIWAGLTRNATRSVFTGLTVVVAFLLFGLLHGINAGMNAVVRDLNLDRLYVTNRMGTLHPLPMAYLGQIATTQAVRQAAPWAYFAGFYRDPTAPLPVIATDQRKLFSMYPELKVPAGELEASAKMRTGAIISQSLAQRFGWKVGDRVPVKTAIWANKQGSRDWYFDIAGIYQPTGGPQSLRDLFLINYDYFDEGRAWGNGTAHMFVVRLDDPRHGSAAAKHIDDLFETSYDQTRTRDEQSYAHTQMSQIGDIAFITNAIVIAVMFTLLFVVASTMMQSVAERISEFALLRTIGFSNTMVVWMVLVEALTLCVAGALTGQSVAILTYPRLSRLFGDIHLPPLVILEGITIAALMAMACAIPAALQVRRSEIAPALAQAGANE
jgi:putative ABC transport system permease protein